jgi:hypothetical protein
MYLFERFLAVSLLIFGAATARAEDSAWHDKNGKPVPDSDHQKSLREFGGLLILTSDPDWEAKWKSPENPSYTTTNKVSLGQTLMGLVLFVNPALDKDGNARVLCDFLITRPDGSISTDMKAANCYEGPIEGSPYELRLVSVNPGFVGEASDVEGIWTINVALTDSVRGVTLELKSNFEYRKSGT